MTAAHPPAAGPGRAVAPPFTDHDSGVTYTPWTDGRAAGYQVSYPGGETGYIYLNASGGSDDGVPTVFVYEGPAGVPGEDAPLHFYDLTREGT